MPEHTSPARWADDFQPDSCVAASYHRWAFHAAKLFLNWLLSGGAQAPYQKITFDNKGPVDSLRIDIPKDYIPLTDRRQDGVRYMDLDDQKVSNPNPPVQVIKDTLAEIGK